MNFWTSKTDFFDGRQDFSNLEVLNVPSQEIRENFCAAKSLTDFACILALKTLIRKN